MSAEATEKHHFFLTVVFLNLFSKKRTYIYLLVKLNYLTWKNVFLGIVFGQFPSSPPGDLYIQPCWIFLKIVFTENIQLLCFYNICCISIFVRKIGMQSNVIAPVSDQQGGSDFGFGK